MSVTRLVYCPNHENPGDDDHTRGDGDNNRVYECDDGIRVMMVMMTTACIGQEVFMKRPPHWEQACCLMYTPSCSKIVQYDDQDVDQDDNYDDYFDYQHVIVIHQHHGSQGSKLAA